MKGRIGTPTNIERVRPRTIKARGKRWCRRCRNTIYPGEWISAGRYDQHRYKCPDPDEAAEAYTKRLVAQQDKKRMKKAMER